MTWALVAGGVTQPVTAVAGTGQPNWGVQSPAQSPVGREFAGMAYDSVRGRTVMFSGGNGGAGTNPLDDTWEWDGTNWTSFATVPAPPASIGPGMDYDSKRGVTVLLDNASHTWEWNGSTWSPRTTATSPPTRVWTSMVFDPVRGVSVLFGGSGTSDLGDTWTYDGTNWTQKSPLNSPSPRFGTAMAFDSARGVVVLFGGRASGTRMNDTWVWDGANWTQRTPATSPFPRFWHSMAYDAQIGETVMFGGDHLEPSLLGPEFDTWLWDGTNWTQDWTFATPSPRAGQAMAYQSANGTVVLFGGSDELSPGTFPTDTWELGSAFVTPAGNPALTFNTNTLTVDVNAIGASGTTLTLLVTSTGIGPILISSITSPSDFAITSNTCPMAPNPFAAGGYCRINLTFTATACGTELGQLTFVDNESVGSQSVGLEGGVLTATCDGDLLIFPPKDMTVASTSSSGVAVNFGAPGSNEAVTSSSCTPATGSVFPIGTTAVTCSVTDPDDVTSTVSGTFHVTVTGPGDSDLALINVPADITVPASGPSGAAVTYTRPNVVDEDATLPPVFCNPAPGSTFPIGTTTVTCTAFDAADAPNTATATFRVTVNDTDLALTNVPADISVAAAGSAGTVVTFTPPTVVDEDATLPPVSCTPAPGTTFPIGTTTVTCTTSDPDDSPSSASATFLVSVGDSDLAFPVTPPNIVVNAQFPGGAVVNFAIPVATDEDGTAPVVSCNRLSGISFPIGNTSVICTAFDADDVPSSVSTVFSVTVNDTDLFLTGVPTNIVADAVSSAGTTIYFSTPGAADEEGAPAVTCDQASGSTYPIGVTTVTCSTSDADDSPSTVSASFTITIRDTDLSLGGVSDITAVAASAAGAAVTYATPVATDEEGTATARCDHPSGSTFPVGVTRVTCTATDPDDSPSSVSTGFFVTVVPDMSLSISVNPTTATAHTVVTTAFLVTNIGAVSRKVSVSYTVTFTDASGVTTVVAADKATVTVAPNTGVGRAFFLTIKNNSALGTYLVTVTATDDTGSVTQTATFIVS